MAARCLLVALGILLLCAPAHAQATGRVGFAGTWDEALAEAKVRNVPVVIFYLRQNDEDCDKTVKLLFRNPVFIKHVAQYALAVVADGATHFENDELDPATGKTRKRCSVYVTIPCSAHTATKRQAGRRFTFDKPPAGFVCDSEGNELFAFTKSTVAGEWTQAIDNALQKIGKRPLTGSAVRKLEKDLYKGDSKRQKGKFKDALKAYTKVLENDDAPDFVKARATARIEALHETVLEAVKTASQLKPSKAKSALKKLKKELAEFEAAREAVHAALEKLNQ